MAELISKQSSIQRFLRIFLICGGVFFFCVAVSLAIYYGLKYHQLLDTIQHKESQTNKTDFLYNSKVTKKTPNDKLTIITRKEWLAQPPIHPSDPLKHPVPYVVILHTATEKCSTQAECTFFARQTQTYHMDSHGWWDIGPNFLVGGDGNVYEGRGWDGIGAFAFGYNKVSIGISFIGTFVSELPPPEQIAAGKALIAEGVRLGKISQDYKLLAHRQISSTESPGLMFFKDIKTWDHWAENP